MLELLSDHRLAVTIHAMDLKNQFCQIDAYCRNVHKDAPLGSSGCHNTSTLAQLMPRRVGASMPLIKSEGKTLGVFVLMSLQTREPDTRMIATMAVIGSQ